MNNAVSSKYRNPILSGFHPDPTICRKGELYYLATSSFEWFPGVPLYRSRDLINWESIGYALSRPSQLDLPPETEPGRGIYAPTLRFHDGLFYMITTLVGRGNFLVTAASPEEEWSDPVWIPDAPGIDPSLFWDDEGNCWYTGTCASRKKNWPHQNDIWLQRLDCITGKLLGERHVLTHGHASNARWTEGPHIYKIEGQYLLLTAEGGTSTEHSVTAFTSDVLTGPYEPCHRNPVLSHRHLGKEAPLGMMGHADLVQTGAGEWWAVLLGRRIRAGISLLSRETFLVPLCFEDSVPLFNPGRSMESGLVPFESKRPDLPCYPVAQIPHKEDFSEEKLRGCWNFLTTPKERFHETGKGLILKGRPFSLDKPGKEQGGVPSFMGRRIEHFSYDFSTKLDSCPPSGEAGITLYLDYANHIRLYIKGREIILKYSRKGNGHTVAREWLTPEMLILGVEARSFDLRFFYTDAKGEKTYLGEIQDARIFTAEQFIGDGFNGPFAGLYAQSKQGDETACFSWCEYKPAGRSGK